MRNSKIYTYFLSLLIVSLALISCNNKKYLAEGQFLYEGSTIKFDKESQEHVKDRKGLQPELLALVYPTPNAKLFGIARTKLWFYNVTKEPKTEKGFRNFLKYKLGEPPVLIEETNPDRISKLITNRLYNKGYFTAKTDYDVKLEDKEGKVSYSISVDKGYTVDTLFYPDEEGVLLETIRRMKSETLIKKGNYYDLDVLKAERSRISNKLRNGGYYYFEPDFLLFKVDSTITGKKVNVYLTLKENINEELLKIYYLEKIIVNPTYDLGKKVDSTQYDTLMVDDYIYLQADSFMRPKIVSEAIYFNKGNPFSKAHHEYTINRLLGLNSYQFVNIQYKKIEDKENKLQANVQLTPYIKRSIRLELSAHTKSNGFTGPGFETSFKNRNLFRGGELLKINFTTGFESQIGNTNNQGLSSFEVGASTELDIPRFIFPFGITSNLSRYTPQTVIKLGAKTLNRVSFFRINSFNASFGYKWQETETKYHELTPINLNYTKLANTEPAFDSILNSNPLVRRSFEEQFIIGSTYSFTYDGRLEGKSKNNYYFNGIADLSGNVVQAITAPGEDASFGDTTSIELLGSKFSQYARFETTQKYYFQINKSSQWVNRLIVGVGLPHGNSRTLPYIKQFFIGGGNSIRAFQARTLGPGSYKRPELEAGSENNAITNTNLFLDQAGDIKLEFNTELRFDIYTIFKGAVFLDVGNIWLLNEDTLRPGGKFEVTKFYDQLAVGTGFGLRIDPDFFVIRFDLGFPIRTPYKGSPNDMNSSGLGRNAVLNIAIGYPF